MVSLNTNVAAMMTQRHLSQAADQNVESQRNLSSGYRINSASDDAAGLQISNTLHVQTRGIDVALRNAHDAYSVAQTAEGALHESSDILQRLRSLGLQAANGSHEQDDRKSLQQEVIALQDELDRVAITTTFADKNLFNGSYGSQSFHIGANANSISLALRNMRTHIPEMGGQHYLGDSLDKDWRVTRDNQQFAFEYQDNEGQAQSKVLTLKVGDNLEEVATYINAQQSVVDASVTQDHQLQFFTSTLNAPEGITWKGNFADEMDIGSGELVTVDDLDMSTVGGAQLAIGVVDAAIKYVDSHRSEIGGFQNRVSGTIDNLNTINRSVSESKGRIRDTDFARESTVMVRSQVLQDATTALLAQAKQRPSSALGLLS
ncbi:flagellin [Vibrio parahaemolyticus]|uniref:Polar flagellin E n=5 Tax=Vibrio parahaemolyticus TaxID=670 RepID=FLAE_VIBPA|nr:flagellin [Vibrio parahaemolyticus]Q9ZBA2.2 RecName: Full=Polar flagellin E [Vibrio parahaemolyticus RIMD 2210633]EFO35801.1 polar flagellin E [Vibrio parahaemolyticus Peru-466]EFO52652.1 polar flagellin E [Vibrio parahaemolyticus K5030]ARC17933.1 flagellin E [Vibrio parahaemolyticus]AZV71684.1 flagellin E [Vibrio parahaemolyticus]EFO39811.1 polar flagellin E [Vibrio parahaemolyticus AN-5034]